ncbi:MAG: DUF4160 domain-containing protein [Rhodospirillales bacterium]|nr:DUF4160 domain-containing protein [Rhodospirillales bacterium]
MPTVLRHEGLRFVIYPNDHVPAHVHVIGPGWTMVVDLHGPRLREAIGCSEQEARRVLRVVAAHRTALLGKWRQWHGEA